MPAPPRHHHAPYPRVLRGYHGYSARCCQTCFVGLQLAEGRGSIMSHVVTIEEPRAQGLTSLQQDGARSRARGCTSSSRAYDFLYGKGCCRPPCWAADFRAKLALQGDLAREWRRKVGLWTQPR